MKYRKRVEKPQGPVSPPLIFWGGAGKAYALLIAAGLLGASPAGARSYGSGPRVEGGRVVVTDIIAKSKCSLYKKRNAPNLWQNEMRTKNHTTTI